MSDERPDFDSHPDPGNAGWSTWNLHDPTRYNGQVMGPMLVRRDSDGKARTRMNPARRHTNLADNVHGGAILGLIDISLFSTARMYGIADVAGAVTLDLSVQFIGGAKGGTPLDAVAELLKQTRRLLFLRGIVEQDGETVAAYSGTVRKPSTR